GLQTGPPRPHHRKLCACLERARGRLSRRLRRRFRPAEKWRVPGAEAASGAHPPAPERAVIRTLVQFALAALMAVMLSGAVCGPSHPPPDPVPDAGHTDVGDDGNGGDAGDDGD